MRITVKKREARKRDEAQKQQMIAERDMENLPAVALIEMLGVAGNLVTLAAWDVLFRRGEESLNALIAGLNHLDARIRADCALLLDHLGDDRCTAPLIDRLYHDPVEAVRRSSLHSLACQGCKECPLSGDIVQPILDAALFDRSIAVRRRAVQYLVGQKRDTRVIAAMQKLQEKEKDAILLARIERAIEWHRGNP